MADWDGLRAELEHSVSPPPLGALRARRRQRQQRRAIAVTCALALVGTASGAALLGRAAERDRVRRDPVAASETELSRIVYGAPLPPPRDYHDHVVTDVDFVSATTGWAIGIRCVGDACDVASWRTDDGGRTWAAPVAVANGVPRASFHEEDPAGGAVRSIRMVDGLRGYAFNPDLYVTTDGGGTWRRDPQPSKVASVSVVGETVWVTERGCPRDADCDLVVRTGRVGGPLRDLGGVPETKAAAAIVRRAGERDAFLLAWDAPLPPHVSFHVSADGGATWHARTHPCPDTTAASLSAAAGRPLWLVCTTPAGRAVYTSADRGTTWRQAGTAPADGEVTDLLATSASHAYLALQNPGRLLVTTDGGRSWQPAPGTGKAFGYANVDLAGGAAFAMGDAGQLWRAPDGVRWERLALPPGAPRATPRPVPSGPDDREVAFGSIWFLDADRGWALGQRCTGGRCRPVLRRTTDGGVTWQRMDAPRQGWRRDGEPAPPNRVTRVRFADERNGWLFGEHVFVTHDGGATWRDVTWGYTFDVEPRGGVLWGVGYEGCLGSPCGPFVVRDRVTADRPRPVDAFEAGGTQAGSFEAVDTRTAYFLDGGSFVEDYPDAPNPVATGTTDGGRTWQAHPAPCPRASRRELSAYAPGGLWALCGGLPDSSLWVTRSADGGATWQTLRLPGSGCCTGTIRAFSATHAWRTGVRAGREHDLFVTRDGGRTWGTVPGIGRVVALTAVDAEHGWLLDGDGYVHRTTDGVTWERLGRP